MKKTTPEERGEANAKKFIQNVDRSVTQLMRKSRYDLEKSFEQQFTAQGHDPATAARMAKLAKDGPEYARPGV